MAEIQEILYRLHKNMSQREIERSLKISRRTIARLLKQAETLGFNASLSIDKIDEIAEDLIKMRRAPQGKGPIASFLKDHHYQIEAWRKMPHMTITQMVRLLKEENKHVSESSLGRYIRHHFGAPIVPTVHLETRPGDQAQVDFAYVGKMKDSTGKLRKTYAFAMILSHSRYRFVRFVFNQDGATWIDCHIRAFHFFGGVPRTVLLDNLRAGVSLPDFYDPLINRNYAELERHYGFVVDPAKVRSPAHKGKIERSNPLIRQQVLAGRSFETIEKANEQALKWCRHEIGMRPCRTTGEAPYERYQRDDKPFLKPLPQADYECPEWQSAKVHRDHHVVFQGSFYSVPTCYIGNVVWIRATQGLVQIYEAHRLIKCHKRVHIKGRWVTDLNDYPEEKRLFLAQDGPYCLEKAREIGEKVFEVISHILEKESLTTRRKAGAILRLAQTYGPTRLEAACDRALLFDNLTYKSIKGILAQNLDQQPLEKSNDVPPTLSPGGCYRRSPHEFSTRMTEVRP